MTDAQLWTCAILVLLAALPLAGVGEGGASAANPHGMALDATPHSTAPGAETAAGGATPAAGPPPAILAALDYAISRDGDWPERVRYGLREARDFVVRAARGGAR